MQIHQPVSHGLLYSLAPQDFANLNLSEKVHDDFDWAEYESESMEESLTGNLLAYLKDTVGA
jgi:hypothetical protein